MAIKDLTCVVGPPASPVEVGDRKQWKEIQKNLGTALPDDFRDIGMTYGSGTFVDRGRIDIYVYQPFSSKFREWVDTHAAILSGFKAGEGDDYIPYDVFPTSPGLLVWGGDVNGSELYWHTTGKPNDWPIVVRSETGEFEEFPGPVSLFLAKAFRREVVVEIWPKPIFSDPNNIIFQPAQRELQLSEDPRTVYELYVANGNKAGFWIRRIDRPGTVYLIKSINGRSSGSLPGTPVEYGRPPVEADAYMNGEYIEPVAKLAAHQRVYCRVDPP